MGKHLTLSSLQTILPPIKHLIDKKAESWDDLKGKPFESEIKEVKFIDNISITLTDLYGDGTPVAALHSFELNEGSIYSVIYDDLTYECKCFTLYETLTIGNPSLLGEASTTNEPFLIFGNPYPEIYGETLNTAHTLSIAGQVETIKKIDPKFLPETAMIVKGPDVTTYTAEAQKANKTAKEIYEAYTSGKQVYFRFTNDFPLIPLVACTETEAVFVGNRIDGISGSIPRDAMSYEVSQDAFRIYEDGAIELFPTDIATLSDQLNNKVPNNRTINGQLLQSNITLTAADVGAATEEYVDNAVANLVDSSPDTLNTLNELAAALGDDPNFATTVTNQIANKADKSEVPTNLMNGNGNWSLRMKSANSASGDFSFTMGAFSEASGHAAVASGLSTKAIGQASHAEGSSTIAIGSASHSEGYESAAVGAYSHAEGRNIALGESSHAESGSGSIAAALKITGDAGATTYTVNIENANEYLGYIIRYAVGSEKNFAQIISADTINNTITTSNTLSSTALTDADASICYGASGVCSHSEGRNSIASGMASHAEGIFTNAYARMSHAEGQGTIAKGNVQHVQGKYNIIDTASKYAHIVGNGESDETRSNAHTLDWSGNAWYQGDVYVGGSGQDDVNAEKLATENYVDNRISEIGVIPILTDSVTGIKYELFVENGTLGMKEVE